MGDPIFYIDRSTIREEARDEVSRRIPRLVEFIRVREPQLIAYDFYLDEHRRDMTVVSIHPDADSLRLHMEVGRAAFQEFADLIDLYSIEVYGMPGDAVLSMLHGKASMLGNGARVAVHQRHSGFLRV